MVQLPETASLWDNLPLAISSEQVQTMEDIGQAYGWILYRTHLKADAAGELVLDQLHSYAQVYVNKKLVGHDRPPPEPGPHHQIDAKAARSSTFSSRTPGRVNFGLTINGERAGITKQVTLAGKPVLGWEIYPLTMTHADKLRFAKKPCEGPCFYRGSFDIGIDGGHLPRHQRLHQGPALAQRTRAGPHLEHRAAEARSTPRCRFSSRERNDVIVFDAQGKMGRNAARLGQAGPGAREVKRHQ